MNHRAKSSKIKYQRNMVQGLRNFLEEELESLEYVTAILPAQIRRTKSTSSRLKVRFKIENYAELFSVSFAL